MLHTIKATRQELETKLIQIGYYTYANKVHSLIYTDAQRQVYRHKITEGKQKLQVPSTPDSHLFKRSDLVYANALDIQIIRQEE